MVFSGEKESVTGGQIPYFIYFSFLRGRRTICFCFQLLCRRKIGSICTVFFRIVCCLLFVRSETCPFLLRFFALPRVLFSLSPSLHGRREHEVVAIGDGIVRSAIWLERPDP